jgi:hypothetical protein
MKAIVHQWLIVHPIWQSAIINVLVGLSLLLLGGYWKVIVAFSRIPPQRLGTWMRKAMLNAAEYKFYGHRRANEDSRYAMFRILVLLWYSIVPVVVMLFGLFAISVALLVPRSSPHPELHSAGLLRSLLLLWASIPMAAFLFYSFKLLWFAWDYAHSKECQDRQLKRINEIRAKLGLSPKAVEIGVDEPIESPRDTPMFSQGMRIESPKYGEGTILRSEMADGFEKVTVQFSLYGIKKMAANFAHLKKL